MSIHYNNAGGRTPGTHTVEGTTHRQRITATITATALAIACTVLLVALPRPARAEAQTETTAAAHTSAHSNLTRSASSQGFSISPDHGPDTGGTSANITVPEVTFAHISAGFVHSLAIGSDGNIYAWGYNGKHQADPYSDATNITPTKLDTSSLPAGIKFSQISGGGSHSLAISTDGNTYAWGANNTGQLGVGNSDPHKIVQVQTGGMHYTQISAGNGFSLALGTDGNIYAWGWNNYGQLGTGDTTDHYTPTRINTEALPAGTTFTAISASCSGDSLALSTDGTIYAWGSNTYGQLGTGDTTDHYTPTPVADIGVRFTHISAGFTHSLAIDTYGNAYGWGGMNGFGQIGTGDRNDHYTPTRINTSQMPAGVGFADINAGSFTSLALGTDKQVYAWGDNESGELGTGDTTSRYVPTAVRNLGNSNTQISLKGSHCLNLDAYGYASTWGNNEQDQLGNGNTTNSDLPYSLPMLEVPQLTSVSFDGIPGTSLSRNTDTTWYVTTPPHQAGTATVNIAWSLRNVSQTPISLDYTYYHDHHMLIYDLQGGTTPASLPNGITPCSGNTSQLCHAVKKGTSAATAFILPTKSGQHFDGWYTSGSHAPFDFSQPLTTNTTIEAHWSPDWITAKPNPTHGSDTGGTRITLTAPPAIKFSHISAGAGFSLALSSDGNIWAWGNNAYGQLGTGDTAQHNTPTQVHTPNGVTFTSVSAGSDFALALSSDGNIYAWGDNAHGQLGDNTTTNRNAPTHVQTPNGITFTTVSAGSDFALALSADGNIWAWGDNTHGQLSNGDTGVTVNSRPSKIIGFFQLEDVTFTSISAGTSHSLAIGSDGNIYAWGDGSRGEIGDGDTTGITTAIPVTSSDGDPFTSVSAGNCFSLATRSDGTTWVWGANNFDQLGTADTIDRSTPTKLTDIQAGISFTAVSAGQWQSLALGSDGNTYAWGWNAYGQLGDGTTTSRSTPVQVYSNGVKFTQISSGQYHSAAIGSDGNTWDWGDNQFSQLADGTTTNRSAPVTAATPTPRPTRVTFGGATGSVSTPNTSDTTWTLTTPAHTAGTVPMNVEWELGGAAQPPATFSFTYELTHKLTYDPKGGTMPTALPSGIVPCSGKAGLWCHTIQDGASAATAFISPAKAGQHFDGWYQTGSNTPFDFSAPLSADTTLQAHWSHDWAVTGTVPARVPNTGDTPITLAPPNGVRFSHISAGAGFSLALGSDGNTYAWGNNAQGQLGTGTSDKAKHTTPAKVQTPSGVTFTSVSAGSDFAIAIGSDGNTYAWGNNNHGQLGTADTANHNTPTQVCTPNGVMFTSVSAGSDFAIAIGSDGNTYAWGNNGSGQLGTGTSDADSHDTPDRVDASGLADGATFVHLSAGSTHCLALDSAGNAWAWGNNNKGELGTADTVQRNAPTKVQMPAGITFSQVSAGYYFSDAIGTNGRVYAWGHNAYYQLGDATSTDRHTPVAVSTVNLPAGIKFTHVAAGNYHTLALASNGNAWAWGNNGNGQLGTSTGNAAAPALVKAPAGVTFTQLSAGQYHSAAIGSDGNTYTWGANGDGQLGTGSTSGTGTPVTMSLPAPQPALLTFGDKSGTAFSRTQDGNWTVNTPAHAPGTVNMTLQWTEANGAKKTSNLGKLSYFPVTTTLPATGGKYFYAGLALFILFCALVLAMLMRRIRHMQLGAAPVHAVRTPTMHHRPVNHRNGHGRGYGHGHGRHRIR